jgi:hypothetical protein
MPRVRIELTTSKRYWGITSSTLLYNLKVEKKGIAWFIFCEKMFPRCSNNEKVVKMLLVPKLAACRTANGCGINYAIQLYMQYLANHV